MFDIGGCGLRYEPANFKLRVLVACHCCSYAAVQLPAHIGANVIVTQMRGCAVPDADYYVTGECRLTSEAARGSGGLGASSAELVRDGSVPLWTCNDYNKGLASSAMTRAHFCLVAASADDSALQFAHFQIVSLLG